MAILDRNPPNLCSKPLIPYVEDRRLLDVDTGDGIIRNARCFAYIMHEDRPLGTPSPRYIQTCMEGYDDFGFDVAVLDKALEDTKVELTNNQTPLSY